MKRVLLMLIAITALLGGTGWYALKMLMPPAAEAATLDPQHGLLANRFLDHLDAARYDEALAMTTPRMREGLGNGKLEDTWEALPRQLGARTSRDAVRGETIDGKPLTTARLAFPMLALDARIVFDDTNAISGFWIVPGRDDATTAAPPTESTELWHESDLDVGSGDKTLPATLTLPRGAGPFDAVVLVHGSGAHDRDSTIGPNKPFRDLAHGLAGHRIAVLRYVKRTKAHPGQFAAPDFTLDDETVNDALEAVATLRRHAAIEGARIYVAGHSLGALAAPRIGQRDPRIAGLILLAAPALPLEDTVIRQMRHIARIDGRNDAAIEASLAELEAQREVIRHLDPQALPQEPLMLGLPAPYWADLKAYDAIATARTIGQPLLILQGGRDYQVTPADDFVLWRNAFANDPRVTLIEYPLLGHAFMPGSDPPGPADYQVAAHVERKVIDDIARWMAAIR